MSVQADATCRSPRRKRRSEAPRPDRRG
jgi:hypothetical protein